MSAKIYQRQDSEAGRVGAVSREWGWRRTGDAEAECVGVGGEEAFEEGGFAGAGGTGYYNWPFLLRRCRGKLD